MRRSAPRDWVEITQERVDQFADATGDHQWIHVDVERAKDGPFGGTIAHGYLTLSLVPWLGSQVFEPRDPRRQAELRRQQGALPQPGAGRLARSAPRSPSARSPTIPAGKQLTLKYVIEIEGQDKPACVAETVVLLLS